MLLSTYLVNIGLVTGPRKKNTSHSGLSTLRTNLLGLPLFQGDEKFLAFGAALHEVFLEDCYDTYNKLLPWEQHLIDKMVDKLRSHPVVMRLLQNARKEKKKYKKIDGVEVAYILDIHQVKLFVGSDLKSTACTSFQDCLKKAISYGYHKQRHIYKAVENLKEFYFVFISKKFPHDIFILGDKDFKPHEEYARKEVEWLLYVYKNYGRFVTEEDLTTKTKIDMTDKAKVSLSKLVLLLKEYRDNRTASEKNAKQADKVKVKILKLIETFPNNEAPLYKERFDKAIKSL